MNSQVWLYKCTLLVAFAGGWDCAWWIWCCFAKMNSWGVRRSWHGFTSAQLETWRLCRGVNKSSFCKSEHIKAYMRHVSGESQVLWRASSYHPSFRNPILYFPYTKTFGINAAWNNYLIVMSEVLLQSKHPLTLFWLYYCQKCILEYSPFSRLVVLIQWELNCLHCSICRGACMSSSCSITMQPVGCVFSSCPSLRPSASPGSTVWQCLTQRANIVLFFCSHTKVLKKV